MLQLLRLNKTSLGKTAAGQVVNLMSNDVQRFDITAGFLNYLWIMPIQAVVSAFVMYNSVGYAAFIGIAAMLLQAVLLQGMRNSCRPRVIVFYLIARHVSYILTPIKTLN